MKIFNKFLIFLKCHDYLNIKVKIDIDKSLYKTNYIVIFI